MRASPLTGILQGRCGLCRCTKVWLVKMGSPTPDLRITASGTSAYCQCNSNTENVIDTSNSIPPFPDQFFCADCQRIKHGFHPKLVCIHENNYGAYNGMEGSAGSDRIPPADLGKWVILAISRGTLIFSRVCPTFWRATVLTRQFRRAVLGQLVRYGKFTNVV